MTDLKLTEQEIRQNVVDDRKKQLLSKFDKGSGQGILPFTNERLFEQSNPILRSALFTAGKSCLTAFTTMIGPRYSASAAAASCTRVHR
ncbi:hypothetical protein [Pseudomonas syringae]|uniref:hypothetical protein n=1 Tax=Pseudomonas syringae TaxID=317 RepID=UPI001F1D1CDC|nr:hypothetical protein [Pseudomonas syringae]MCF5461003.1 hypothetical protein [Pseudomonas syringae]